VFDQRTTVTCLITELIQFEVSAAIQYFIRLESGFFSWTSQTRKNTWVDWTSDYRGLDYQIGWDWTVLNSGAGETQKGRIWPIKATVDRGRLDYYLACFRLVRRACVKENRVKKWRRKIFGGRKLAKIGFKAAIFSSQFLNGLRATTHSLAEDICRFISRLVESIDKL